MRYSHWVEQEVLTLQWWFLLLLFLISWAVWWRLVDKGRLFEIGFLGLFIACAASLMDATGTELGFWTYHYKLFPLYNRLLTADLTLIPICFMLIYQWFPGWKPYVCALAVLALGASFVAEWVFAFLDIYEPVIWKSYYSFPIYLLLGVAAKGMMLCSHKIIFTYRARRTIR
ncbi:MULTISPECIES: CBO0543 family protein [Paenibacillus]|uniref:CBO0543 family protein n=1 Tax=Paenibacillus TaxID=44249 RepID=UPI0022B89EC2|nr:CBO0543 family protein [Paenibacillus caseinilyticus]MCZ8519843.1 hypothetical protein [Paenibacillus caseinilyticus]